MEINGTPGGQSPPKMKIAGSSCCWWHHSLEESVRLAAAAGFTAFEPLMFPAEIFALHGDLRKINAAQLVRLLGDHGLVLAGLHLVVVGGPDRATEPFLPFLKALEELEPLVRGTPVRIALENHYGNWIQFIQDYEHIFDYLQSPNIGLTLDTGHFTSAGVDPEAVARRFGVEKVFHVHIKDHRGTQSVPLGTGTTNNKGTAQVLKGLGYTGYLSQEIECGRGPAANQAAADGIHYMRRLLEV